MIYFGIAIIIILILYLFLTLKIAKEIIFPKPHMKPPQYNSPEELNIPFETYKIPYSNGIIGEAWFFPAAESKRTLVLFHGIHLSKKYLIPFSKAFQEFGYNVFLPDLRAHGNSEGKYLHYGTKEVSDISEMITWLEKNKPFEKLYFWGISYGGIIGTQAANQLQTKIDAAVWQSVYTNLDTIVKWTVHKRLGGITALLMPGVRLWVKVLAGFWLSQVEVLKACQQNLKPQLFIAAEKDEVCPLIETITIHQSCKNHAEMWIVKNASHNNIHKVVGEHNYFQKIHDFLKRF